MLLPISIKILHLIGSHDWLITRRKAKSTFRIIAMVLQHVSPKTALRDCIILDNLKWESKAIPVTGLGGL
jgi:hypothetical protein